jgi:hypothetical protein
MDTKGGAQGHEAYELKEKGKKLRSLLLRRKGDFDFYIYEVFT